LGHSGEGLEDQAVLAIFHLSIVFTVRRLLLGRSLSRRGRSNRPLSGSHVDVPAHRWRTSAAQGPWLGAESTNTSYERAAASSVRPLNSGYCAVVHSASAGDRHHLSPIRHIVSEAFPRSTAFEDESSGAQVPRHLRTFTSVTFGCPAFHRSVRVRRCAESVLGTWPQRRGLPPRVQVRARSSLATPRALR